jgi:predicted amidohydrolase YtcJ
MTGKIPQRSTWARRLVLALILGPGVAAPALAQEPDTVLLNGKVVTVDRESSIREAIAIRDGKIVAIGRTAEIGKLAGPRSRVIDVQGRTVIPGLIDSHLHAIRAAQTFATEVNWTGVRSLKEAIGRIHDASLTKPGAWLIVAGGWTERQFVENRRPTQAELQAAAPNNPVYVQLGYTWVVMTRPALEALKIDTASDGVIAGRQDQIVALFDRLPKPTFDQQVEGTRAFFRELNRLGMTGVVDPGGNNLFASDYQAVLNVWRQGQLTVRVAYALCGQTPGRELEELKGLTALLPMGFGDDMLRFNGIGERITVAMNNNDSPSAADEHAYYTLVRWAAERGMTLTMHWGSDRSVGRLLSIFERVNREVPIAPLRWSIAHLNDASVESLTRMKALGVGWTMQDAMYFGGDQLLESRGAEVARRTPPLETARRLGVMVGAGTDAHRVASYNPFTSLQWILDGKSVSGTPLRGAEETPDRVGALRLYTMGSAWFSHDEDTRGSLEVGKLADLAVLSRDVLTVPVDQIGGIESLLTMVGGKVVYAAGDYALP